MLLSMAERPSTRDIVRMWFERLDRVDYFTLLRVAKPKIIADWPSDVDLRRAFSTFAGSFHPDRFKDEDEETRERAMAIFRRANEAVRVLTNPALRVRYMRALDKGKVRLEGEELTRAATMHAMAAVKPDAPMPNAPPAPPSSKRMAAVVSLASLCSHSAAIDFAQQADLLIAKGEGKKALFQAQLALNKEPNNEALAERVTALRKSLGLA
jgi:curved DNA-binding protein CbpA